MRIPSMSFSRSAFFSHVRAPLFGGFPGDGGASQIAGLDAILDEWEKRGGGDLRWLAYMLATAFVETAHTMQPVREAFWLNNAEAWRKKHLRYYPYYGRGYVQLTWKANYAKADSTLGLGGTLVRNLDRALEPALAADIMFEGMRAGWFTGRKLADYISGTRCEYVGARRIINGTDRAAEIARYALIFEKAVRAGYAGRTASPDEPVVILPISRPEDEKPKPAASPAQTAAVGSAVTGAIVAAGGGVTAGHFWLVAVAVAVAVLVIVGFIIVRRKG